MEKLSDLQSMLGGDFAYLAELIDSFLEDAPKMIADLDSFIKNNDSAGVQRIGHSLKSNGADFGANTFSELCKELEMVGKSGALDGADELATRIVKEYSRVEAALKSVLQAGSVES
jgi:HPt (histidine-containing phosphotransfer) domain-containing protein